MPAPLPCNTIVEKQNTKKYEKKIALLSDLILKTRKNMGGVNAAKDNQIQIQKQ